MYTRCPNGRAARNVPWHGCSALRHSSKLEEPKTEVSFLRPNANVFQSKQRPAPKVQPQHPKNTKIYGERFTEGHDATRAQLLNLDNTSFLR